MEADVQHYRRARKRGCINGVVKVTCRGLGGGMEAVPLSMHPNIALGAAISHANTRELARLVRRPSQSQVGLSLTTNVSD